MTLRHLLCSVKYEVRKNVSTDSIEDYIYQYLGQ